MAFNLPPTLTDTLSAVNILLQCVGESPVSSVEGGEAVDVTSALNTLEEISRAVQTEGWPWNRDYEVPLTPDNTGRCALPDNALRIALAYPGPHSGTIVERKRFAYDPRNRTFTFTDPIILDLVVKLDFEELPEAARRYVTTRAAKQFQGRLQTSAGVERITDEEVALSRAALEQEEDEVDGHNSIQGNADVQRKLQGRWGMRRRC